MDSPWGGKELDTTEQLSLHFTSVQYIFIEDPEHAIYKCCGFTLI